jgi:hypothetical protein
LNGATDLSMIKLREGGFSAQEKGIAGIFKIKEQAPNT